MDIVLIYDINTKRQEKGIFGVYGTQIKYDENSPKMTDLSTIDLLALTEIHKRAATTNGGEYAGPCPFRGGEDRFRVWPDHPDGKGRWWCRQCERSGDAIDFVRQRDNLAYPEALELLNLDAQGSPTERKPHRTQRNPQKSTSGALQKAELPTWDQREARALVEDCEVALWSDAGAKARAWLADRGLTDHTIKGWHLGYNDKDRDLRGLWVRRGILIPCFSRDWRVWYLKIRRAVPGGSDYNPQRHGPKYVQVKGAGRGALFGLSHLGDRKTLTICEGELDSILLWQEAGDLVDVVATGSATTRPAPEFLAHLAGASRWLVALDQDKAGDAGAVWWDDFSQRVRRVRPLQGNDLTDFYLAGGDLRTWITYHLEKPEYGTDRNGTETWTDLDPGEKKGAPWELEAEALLDRMNTDPEAVRQYAELAEAQGWPCGGLGSWQEWAAGVVAEREMKHKRATRIGT